MKKVVLKSGKQCKLNCKDKPLFGLGVQAFAKVTPLRLSAYPGFQVITGLIKRNIEGKDTMLLLIGKTIQEKVFFFWRTDEEDQQLVRSRGD